MKTGDNLGWDSIWYYGEVTLRITFSIKEEKIQDVLLRIEEVTNNLETAKKPALKKA